MMLTRSSSDCYSACPDPNLQVVFPVYAFIYYITDFFYQDGITCLLTPRTRKDSGRLQCNSMDCKSYKWIRGLSSQWSTCVILQIREHLSKYVPVYTHSYINILGVNGTTTCVFCRLYLRGEGYQACSVHISFLTHAHAPRLNHVAIGWQEMGLSPTQAVPHLQLHLRSLLQQLTRPRRRHQHPLIVLLPPLTRLQVPGQRKLQVMLMKQLLCRSALSILILVV